MEGLKNLIARRRPKADSSDAFETTAVQTDADVAPPHAGAADHPPDRSAEGQIDDLDLKSAIMARDHVPSPISPKALSYPAWTRPQTRLAQTQGAPEMPVEGGSDRPVKKVWALEADAQGDVPAGSEVRPKAPRPASRFDNDLPGHEPEIPAMPQAAPARPGASERVKTRLLGFHDGSAGQDFFSQPAQPRTAAGPQFPIGWVVVTDGPGRGTYFALPTGLSSIGRDPDQTVALNFGDTSISRSGHVYIAFDEEEKAIYVGHGGKQNIVRLNDRPLISNEKLSTGDVLKIGKTALQFVAFCGPDFTWSDDLPEGDDT